MPTQTAALYADLSVKSRETQNFVTSVNDPECDSYFRWAHSRHAPFGLEQTLIPAQGGNPVAYNVSGVKFKFPKIADAIWKTTIVHDVCGLAGVYTDADGKIKVAKNELQPYYCPAFGFAINPRVALVVSDTQVLLERGGQGIPDYLDDITAQASDVQLQLATLNLEQADGSPDVARLQRLSRKSRQVSHPLKFSFCVNSGLALLTTAMYVTGAGLDVDFASREKVICKPKGAPLNMVICRRPDGVTDDDIESGRVVLKELADTDIKAKVDTIIVAMDDEEQGQLMPGGIEQCISDIKVHKKTASMPSLMSDSDALEYPFQFQAAHHVQSYTVVCRPKAALDANRPFQFWHAIDQETGEIVPPITSMSVDWGTSPRLPERSANYFTERQHADHCARIARDKQVYKVHWCVDAQDPNHSGGPDHQQIDMVTLHMKLDPRNFTQASPTMEIIAILEMRRLLKYRNGGAVLRYNKL